jgi:hypothetical protein
MDMTLKMTLMPVVLVLLAAGCYKQRPLETMPPVPATRIIADLTDGGTAAMANAIGAGVLGIEGVVAAADDSTWTMQMVRTSLRDGRTIEWNREVVRFPAFTLTDPRIVVFDKKRSWLAAGGITIGALIVARSFNLIGSPEEDDSQTPPAQ